MAGVLVLGASVLIAFFDSQDNRHSNAYRLLANAIDEDFAIDPFTLAEVLVAPVRDGRLDQVLAALEGLEVTELACPADTAVRLARLQVTTGLALSDCCVVLAAEDAGASIATFDERLTRCAEMRNLTVVRS